QVELHLIAMCVFPYSASTCMPVEAVTIDVHPALQQVIEEYEDVFAIPKELPPKRDHFHNIPLIEGDQPVNIRPYRHPPTQKDAIKDGTRIASNWSDLKEQRPFLFSYCNGKEKG
nr:retrotransposon protein, putative, unclassified [Tanacetum cinerariifolium]